MPTASCLTCGAVRPKLRKLAVSEFKWPLMKGVASGQKCVCCLQKHRTCLPGIPFLLLAASPKALREELVLSTDAALSDMMVDVEKESWFRPCPHRGGPRREPAAGRRRIPQPRGGARRLPPVHAASNPRNVVHLQVLFEVIDGAPYRFRSNPNDLVTNYICRIKIHSNMPCRSAFIVCR